MRKFTEGEWKLDKHSQFSIRIDGTGAGVALVNRIKDDEEAKANARLIAAAPGLYDFIDRLTRVDDNSYDADEKLTLIIDNAKSIIKSLDLEKPEPQWYEQIPPQGRLCWVSDQEGYLNQALRLVTKYDRANHVFKFETSTGCWKFATPLTDDEIKVYLGGEK